MKRSISDKNGEDKRSYNDQESFTFGYNNSYPNYSVVTSTASAVNQPLPGQPPLPPMPPPQNGIPPPPHMFGTVPSQVPQLQAWAHPPPPPPQWQWMPSPASQLNPQTSRDMSTNAFHREMSLHNNYGRRERFTHNRTGHNRRNSYHHWKKRVARVEPMQSHFQQTAYFNATLTNSLGLEWQRNNYASAGDSIMNQLSVPLPNHSIPQSMTQNIVPMKQPEKSNDQKCNSVDDVVVKKKLRKPMSASYPSRPWNLEDAERALKVENEFNKIAKAQSLIIKFPDPDLNKEIVKEFHSGIQNIHFQSPSGPRYCFIQMDKSINIDEAIKELEKIKFGTGYLKVERKSLRDEDNPMPEEIDPYTLYIGNLPESINVAEVKNKFPSASRVDVGFAQKMRNTRYAFIRFNSVDESIEAYVQSHDLMWDTRSIIVRFRRQRGNTGLSNESKANAKKNEEIANKKDEKKNNTSEVLTKNKPNVGNSSIEQNKQENNSFKSTLSMISSETSTVVAQLNQETSNREKPNPLNNQRLIDYPVLDIEIKKEPEDYDELYTDDDGDGNDDSNTDEDDEICNDNGIDDVVHDEDNENEEEEEDGLLHNEEIIQNNAAPDNLDKIFNDLDNMTGEVFN